MSELERYRIDEEIGRGAMGVVYRAWDLTLEREVALKELTFPAGMATSVRQEMVERFFREARSAARLTHPNVVQVFDVLSEGDRYFIAMELLSGAPLGALLERGPLPASAAVQIMVQILDGVQAAHSAGIVHRDLKPDNIHILDDGRVKVTDFGIAKIMSGLGTGTMTQMGTIIGTPGYMAPEQVRGEAVDHRTDVFALGVVFYEMLAGSNPFLADAPTTILYRIVHEEPPQLPSGADAAGGTLGAIARKALSKDPNDRYQTAAAMAADLRASFLPGSVSLPGLQTVGGAAAAPGRSGIKNGLVIGVGSILALAAVTILFLGLGSGGAVGSRGGASAAPVTPAAPAASAPVAPAPAQPPAAPPAIAGLPDPPYWAVFFGAWNTQREAEAYAKKARARGLTVSILDTRDYTSLGTAKNESRGLYCFNIFLGPFSSKSAAQSALKVLTSKGYDGYVKQNKG
jgi:hypothetical protein